MLRIILFLGLFTGGILSAVGGDELDYVYDLHNDRAKLEAQRDLRHKQLLDKGITSREAHLNVDRKFQKQARQLEAKRQRAVKAIFNKAGIEMPQQMGTDPNSGRGILGDIDTANMPRQDLHKLQQVIEAHNRTPGVKNRYTVTDRGGYIRIKELDVTTFKQMNNPDGFVFTRGAGKETALAYRTNTSGETDNLRVYKVGPDGKKVLVNQKTPAVVDKNIYNLDNMKKVGEDFSRTNLNEVDFQNAGKGTMRIIENTYGKNLEKITDPVKKAQVKELLNQCRDLKSFSPETAGLQSDAAKQKFMNDAKAVIGESYRECAGHTESALASQRDATWKKMQELKQQLKQSRGQNSELKAELEATKKFYDAESKQLYDYRQKQLAAERGIIKNGGGELLAEAKGGKVKKMVLPDGSERYFDLKSGRTSTPSQLEEKLLGPRRKQLIETEVPPHHNTGGNGSEPKPLIAPPDDITVSQRSTIGTNQTFQSYVNKAGDVVDVYNMYKTADAYLPADMDPSTRKGLLLAITAASTNQVTRSVLQGAVGGGQAGFDELVKWYKENPGREPTQWETLKIGMRGGNRFVIDMAKGAAYGFTVKPFEDVYDIGYGLGDTIYQRQNAEQAAAVAREMDSVVTGSYNEQLVKLRQRLKGLDDIVARITADPLHNAAETEYADKVATESSLAAKLVHNAAIVAGTRNDENSVVKEVRDPKTGKMKKVIVSSRTSIEDRQRAVAQAADRVDRVGKMVEKLIAMRNTCTLTVNLIDGVTGKALAADSWMTVNSGNYSEAPRGQAVLRAAGIPGGQCAVVVKAVGYAPSSEVKLILNPLTRRDYACKVKMMPAEAENPLYAEYTLSAADAATKQPLKDVSFKIVNNKRTVDFSSPTGAMKVNLESGECRVDVRATGYRVGRLSFKVDTAPDSNRNRVIYLKNATSTPVVRTYSGKRKYSVYFEFDNPKFALPKDFYSLDLVNLETGAVEKVRKGSKGSAYVAPGKYKVTLSGPEINTLVQKFEVGTGRMTLKLPFTPKNSGTSWTISFTLPKFDQMVKYEKVNEFLKSKTQVKYLFTVEREGYLEITLNATGHGNVSVSALDKGKTEGGLLLGYTPPYRKGNTRNNISRHTFRKSDIGERVIARASIFDTNVKRSRKSDYDDEDRVFFAGGKFSGKVTFYTLPLKTIRRRP